MSVEQSPARLLKLKHVRELTTLSKTSIYNKMAAGNFPKPVKLGPKAVAWRARDIEEWINHLQAGGEA